MAMNFSIGESNMNSNAGVFTLKPAFNVPAPSDPTPGSLVIQDSFVPSNQGEAAHGELVNHAALAEGFQGKMERRGFRQNAGQAVQACWALGGSALTPEQALKALNGVVDGEVTGLLNEESCQLEMLTGQGYKNSATNVSMGVSQATVVDRLSGPLTGLECKDPKQRKLAQTVIANQARALELDPAPILNPDPKIHRKARQQYQQALIDYTSNYMKDSPQIKTSRQRYDQAVENFERNNNSVVVSAGNWGEYPSNLEAINGGLPLSFPEDYTKNVLENDAVTSVGATRWVIRNGRLSEQKAEYTSGSPGVDIYASGSIGLKNPNVAEHLGTSFAAPKVAATMAQLHKLNPHLSSTQVESLMKQRLTHSLAGDNLTVLDYRKNFEFLKTNRY